MQLLDSQDRHDKCYPQTTNGKIFKDKQKKGMKAEKLSFLRDTTAQTVFIDVCY